MDYPVLCSATVRDQNGKEMILKLIAVYDNPVDGQPYKIEAPNGDYLWWSAYEPDYDEYEAIFTAAIEKEGGTFIELID